MLTPKRNPLVYWLDSIEKSSWSGCIIVYVQILSQLNFFFFFFFFFLYKMDHGHRIYFLELMVAFKC